MLCRRTWWPSTTVPTLSTQGVLHASEHEKHEQGRQLWGTRAQRSCTEDYLRVEPAELSLAQPLQRTWIAAATFRWQWAAPSACRAFSWLKHTPQEGGSRSFEVTNAEAESGGGVSPARFNSTGGGAEEGTHPSFFSGLGAALGHRLPFLVDT